MNRQTFTAPKWPYPRPIGRDMFSIREMAPPDVYPGELTKGELIEHARLLSLQVLDLERRCREFQDNKNSLRQALRPFIDGL